MTISINDADDDASSHKEGKERKDRYDHAKAPLGLSLKHVSIICSMALCVKCININRTHLSGKSKIYERETVTAMAKGLPCNLSPVT